MYCKKCGAKINNEDKFCGSCGESVYKEDKEEQPKKSSSIGKKKKSKIAIIGILLFLIIIVAALIFVITKQNKKEEQLNQLKEQLKNADSYLAGYIIDDQDDIEEWKTQSNWAVENQNIEATKKLLLEWDEIIEEIDKENKEKVSEKLKELESADVSKAYKSELESIDSWKKKIKEYVDNSEYKKANKVFIKWQELIDEIQIPANLLDISVYQVDTTEFPKIRLYLDMKDEMQNTPQGILKETFELKEEIENSSKWNDVKITKVEQLDQKERLNINMVADVSGSMNGDPIERAKYTMTDFLNQVQFSVGDRVELTVFSDAVEVYQPFIDEKGKLGNQIQSLQLGNMTSLYDALYAAVNRTALQNGAKCVIAFTDGRDNISACSIDTVISTANRYHIPIYLIGIGDDLDYNALNRIANETAGYYTQIDSFDNMREVYKRIYREQKELYLLEYKTENAKSTILEHNLQLKADNRQWQGECNFSYTPNILQTIDDSVVINGDEIDTAIGNYLRGFIDAINTNDFSYMEDTVVAGSPIEKEQRKYIKKDVSEQIQNFEITEKEMKGDTKCIVTVRETYDIDKPNEPLHMLVQQAKYELRKQSNGEWKLYSFYEPVKKLQKLNY